MAYGPTHAHMNQRQSAGLDIMAYPELRKF
jgi:hypothetical protein